MNTRTPTLRSRLWTHIDDLGDTCPVQGQGEIRKGSSDERLRFYFRARGNHWSFGIGDTDDDAVDVAMGLRDGFRRREEWGQGDFCAGFMPIEIATELIYCCVEEFFLERNQKR